jgi:hypothetical protein
VGHIVTNRNAILRQFDANIGWPDDDFDRYKRESRSITESAQALPLDHLLASLDHAQTLLVEVFQQATNETRDKPKNDGTLADWVAFQHFHETYHVGQLELLRNLAGKVDKII